MSTSPESADMRTYAVVVNDEGQHSIWDSESSAPAGWHAVGMTGSKSDCLAYIDRVWTDMRPISLRRAMGELGDETVPR
jgi:MbtH protein